MAQHPDYQEQLQALFFEYVEQVLKPRWRGASNPAFDPDDPKAWVEANVPGDWNGFRFEVDPSSYGCGCEKTYVVELPYTPEPPSDLRPDDVEVGYPDPEVPASSSSSSLVCCCC